MALAGRAGRRGMRGEERGGGCCATTISSFTSLSCLFCHYVVCRMCLWFFGVRRIAFYHPSIHPFIHLMGRTYVGFLLVLLGSSVNIGGEMGFWAS